MDLKSSILFKIIEKKETKNEIKAYLWDCYFKS